MSDDKWSQVTAAFDRAAAAAERVGEAWNRGRGWNRDTGECLADWCPDRSSRPHYHSAPPRRLAARSEAGPQ